MLINVSFVSRSQDAKKGTELDYVLANKNPLMPKPVYLELWVSSVVGAKEPLQNRWIGNIYLFSSPQQGSPLFAIRQKIISPEMTEGTIFLLGPLDFEKQAMYHLTVLANVSKT